MASPDPQHPEQQFVACPKCSEPFRPFLRYQVYSFWRTLLRRPGFARICWACKEIIGYE